MSLLRLAGPGLVALAVTAGAAFADTVTITDGTGNEVAIDDTSRIVALGGDVSEIIFALGAGDRIVANDTTSVYPYEAVELPKVGYVRNVAAEGLLSMEPTLIIANSDAGPPATLDQIESVGIPVVRMVEDFEVESVPAKIRMIGSALSLDEEAEALAQDVEARLAEAIVTGVTDEDRVPALFILNASNGAPMAAGLHTRADSIIHLAGGRNVFDSHEGYRAFSPEAAIASEPRVIIMMSHTLEALGGLEGVRAHPALGLTPAATEGNVLAMDGLFLLGFGPRTPEAIAEVRGALESAAETD